jgi:hypothetical protein
VSLRARRLLLAVQMPGEVGMQGVVALRFRRYLAYVVRLAHERARVGGGEVVTPLNLRNTMVLRPEDGTWKIVHLHGDPITTPQSAESVIQQ